jgi:glycosyltransferase involved in cell wall biosynthesis
LSSIKFSIITIVRNDKTNIRKTLESVLQYDYDNIEYVVIDGASTDGTVDIIREYENDLVFFKSEPDRGIGDAWNKGLQQCSGDIIGILNAGDTYDTCALKIVSDSHHIEDPQVIYYGQTYLIKDGTPSLITNDFNPSKFYRGFGFMHTSCFVPKYVYDQIGQFSTKYKIAVDTDWLFRAFKKGIKFKELPYQNFMDGNGVSMTNLRKARNEYLRQLIKYRLNIPRALYYLIRNLLFSVNNKKS